MLISCNRLKKYIKNPEDIDFQNIWDDFTLRVAEVEGVTVKGNDMDNVVTAQITEVVRHPESDKLSLLKVTDGVKEYNIVCGAPNVRVGLIGALVREGGMVSGIHIKARKLAGYPSEGMMCAVDELGIGTDHEGILELPSDTPIGVDFKSLYPVEDIIVEIDNKSLTNRPDLWGHYGIAREVCAITNHELLPLELLEISNDKEDLDIQIENKDLCKRYCGLEIKNLKNNKTPLDMQIFLFYAGMRSINLFVDVTNYLMLELGQPMHAFDERVVKNIQVRLAHEGDTYTTLDGVERKLSSDTLMITNGDKYFGIAGIMGGLDSEILPDTTSVFIESACFDAGSIRKSAVRLGLRTEASARYEKSLDPNMCDVAIKRLAYLLKQENPDMEIASNLTDVYPSPLKEKTVVLKKDKLKAYTAIDFSSEDVVKSLSSLGFTVKDLTDSYEVVVPTFRATKDVSMDADIIEEIVRLYGYENIKEIPLKLELTGKEDDTVWNMEYDVKRYLATRYSMNEVHSYLWYDTAFLKECHLEKSGVTLLGKTENNLLRDDLSLSLLPIVKNNLKNVSQLGIFEIGTVIVDNENHRRLSIILADDESRMKDIYYQAKEIVLSLFKSFKHQDVEFKKGRREEYYDEDLSNEILVARKCIGYIHVFNGECTRYIGKKKAMVAVDIDFDFYVEGNVKDILYQAVSKYPEVTLDYTILVSKNSKYEDLLKVLKMFTNKYVKGYQLVGTYEDKDVKKYTIRYTLGSENKTLEGREIDKFKEKFMEHITKNGLEILV